MGPERRDLRAPAWPETVSRPLQTRSAGRQRSGGDRAPRRTSHAEERGGLMMAEDRSGPEDLALPDPVDDYLSLVTLLSNAIPVFGGAVGWGFGESAAARRAQRLRAVLTGIVADVKALGAKVQEEYVRSEEFKDLLDHTLRRVVGERHEEKRRMSRALLLDAITATSPRDYDEQLRMLRTMDQLQVAHLKIIRAVMQPRDPNTDMYMGSPGHVLERRLRDMPLSRINDLVYQLNDLNVLALN